MTEEQSGTTPEQAPAKARKAAKSTEAVYSREDLMRGASAFGTTPAGMAGALKHAEIEGGTKEEVTKAVEAFNELELASRHESTEEG